MGMQVPPPVTSIYTPNGQLLATEVAGRLRVGEGASGCAGHSVVAHNHAPSFAIYTLLLMPVCPPPIRTIML